MQERGLAAALGAFAGGVAFAVIQLVTPDPGRYLGAVTPAGIVDVERSSLLADHLRMGVEVGLAVTAIALVGTTVWAFRRTYPLALAALAGLTWILLVPWADAMALYALKLRWAFFPIGLAQSLAFLLAVAVLAWFLVDSLTSARAVRMSTGPADTDQGTRPAGSV